MPTHQRCIEQDCGEFFWAQAAQDLVCPPCKARKRARKRQRNAGRLIDPAGYARVRDESGRTRAEHRIVMESMLGRPLREGESVHHRNGDRADNRPENLELWASSHPYGQRATELICPHCSQPYHTAEEIRSK